MKKTLLLLVMCFIGVNTYAQKAKEYYGLLLKADAMVIENKLDSALYFYNSAFEKYDYPFYAHIKRAAILANFSGDEIILEKLLKKCIQKGMPQFQFDYFLESGLNQNTIQKIEQNYSNYYEQYLAGIDTSIVFEYLDLDAKDLLLHTYMYGYSKDSIKDKFYANFQKEALKEYLKLIDEVGYPSEENVGLPKLWKFELFKKKKLNNDKWSVYPVKKQLEFIDGNKEYYFGYHENPNYLNHSHTPGSWYYWHYPAVYYKDTTLFPYLERGFEELKLGQIYISHYFESIHDVQYDFCTTYYSYLYSRKYRSKAGIFNRSTEAERVHINALRAEYYIQSIDKQEQLLMTLYRLKYGKDRAINKRMVKKIKYEYHAFVLCPKM